MVAHCSIFYVDSEFNSRTMGANSFCVKLNRTISRHKLTNIFILFLCVSDCGKQRYITLNEVHNFYFSLAKVSLVRK